jgi:hypothetical protein
VTLVGTRSWLAGAGVSAAALERADADTLIELPPPAAARLAE